MTRIQRILTGLLIVQLILAVVVFWPQENVQAVGEPLFGDIQPDGITAVTIEDNDGNTVSMTRDGDEWVLSDRDNYPVNETKVRSLLDKLTAVNTNRLVTRTEASHNRLQIGEDNFIRRLQLVLADGSEQVIYMGTAANARAMHIRPGAEDAVYLATDLASYDASAAVRDWIDTSYISLTREEITAVTLENGNGTFEFQKDSDGEWSLADIGEDEVYDPARFNTLLSRIANMRMTEPLGTTDLAEYNLDAPLATVTVTIENDEGTQTDTLLVGARDEANNTTIVKWSGSDYVVKVSNFNVKDMVETTRADLLEDGAETDDTETEAEDGAEAEDSADVEKEEGE